MCLNNMHEAPHTSSLVEVTDVSGPGIQLSLFAVLHTDPSQELKDD